MGGESWATRARHGAAGDTVRLAHGAAATGAAGDAARWCGVARRRGGAAGDAARWCGWRGGEWGEGGQGPGGQSITLFHTPWDHRCSGCRTPRSLVRRPRRRGWTSPVFEPSGRGIAFSLRIRVERGWFCSRKTESTPGKGQVVTLRGCTPVPGAPSVKLPPPSVASPRTPKVVWPRIVVPRRLPYNSHYPLWPCEPTHTSKATAESTTRAP